MKECRPLAIQLLGRTVTLIRTTCVNKSRFLYSDFSWPERNKEPILKLKSVTHCLNLNFSDLWLSMLRWRCCVVSQEQGEGEEESKGKGILKSSQERFDMARRMTVFHRRPRPSQPGYKFNTWPPQNSASLTLCYKNPEPSLPSLQPIIFILDLYFFAGLIVNCSCFQYPRGIAWNWGFIGHGYIALPELYGFSATCAVIRIPASVEDDAIDSGLHLFCC